LPGTELLQYSTAMRKATALLALALGCANLADHDGRVPGTELGTFHATASLGASTCGSGALGSADTWEFDVKLSREGSRLFWLNGAAPVEGNIAADGRTFGFETSVMVEVAPAQGRQPGCTVERADSAAGTLAVADDRVDGFDGKIEYAYSAANDSDCTGLIGVSGGFATLPCSLGYGMAAKLTKPAQR
jgi:hypothetical protein